MAPVRSVFVAAACAVATAFTPLGTARVPLASPMHMSAPATGTGPSLQFQEGTDPSFKGGRLGDKLKEADTQRRKDREAAEARERAAELAREERKRKIDFMYEMDENTPAGTVNDYMYKGGVCWFKAPFHYPKKGSVHSVCQGCLSKIGHLELPEIAWSL